MSPNRIARYLGKPPEEFTKKDLIRFIKGNNIEMVNFRYAAGDGRLKTLNFVITGRAELDRLLSAGERVDGSSLFPYVEADSSDMYVVPRYKTAFVNPFSEIPAIDILCSYYTSKGERFPGSPENILSQAHRRLTDSTGLTLKAMGELEYYVVHDAPASQAFYPVMPQKGYQESSPFSKWERLRCRAMQFIAQAGGKIKYAHSEVGHIRMENRELEQHEIELLPVPVEDAADQLVIARWMLRTLGFRHGVGISFSPKISPGHAGNGLHIHMNLSRRGRNVLLEGNRLSDTARKAIAGILSLAPSLTAFGNTVPVSYLRLVPHQEAPTNICWGDSNRSVLVRVPLGWADVKDMAKDANPHRRGGKTKVSRFGGSQTVEFRCSDGSADIYLLLAGLAVAARRGLEMENALNLAQSFHVNASSGIRGSRNRPAFAGSLPSSCWESAENLVKDREIYQKDGVFSPVVIDEVVKKLKSYNDSSLGKKICGREDEIKKLLNEYL